VITLRQFSEALYQLDYKPLIGELKLTQVTRCPSGVKLVYHYSAPKHILDHLKTSRSHTTIKRISPESALFIYRTHLPSNEEQFQHSLNNVRRVLSYFFG